MCCTFVNIGVRGETISTKGLSKALELTTYFCSGYLCLRIPLEKGKKCLLYEEGEKGCTGIPVYVVGDKGIGGRKACIPERCHMNKHNTWLHSHAFFMICCCGA